MIKRAARLSAASTALLPTQVSDKFIYRNHKRRQGYSGTKILFRKEFSEPRFAWSPILSKRRFAIRKQLSEEIKVLRQLTEDFYFREVATKRRWSVLTAALPKRKLELLVLNNLVHDPVLLRFFGVQPKIAVGVFFHFGERLPGVFG